MDAGGTGYRVWPRVKGDPPTYDDMPEGKTDFGMARFSIAHDEKQILPLLRQALRHNRNLKVMGTRTTARTTAAAAPAPA